MNRHLRPGDQVMLRVTSEYATPGDATNPTDVVGTVRSVPTERSDEWVTVLWGRWNSNVYPPDGDDLYIVGQTAPTFKTREEARANLKEGFVVVDLGSDKENRWSISVKEI